MANTTVNLIGLDFDTIKNNLKTYLRNNTQFKDIDFEGSNISQLIELLAYNTYLNGFYANMIGAEMFMDSATQRDAVVSRSKELNYTPRSFNSASATLAVTVTPASPVATVVIPEGTPFTSKVGSNTYTFSTEQSFILTTMNGTTFSANVEVFEGFPVTESYTVNYANTSQRFVMSNPTIDTETIDVLIYEDGGSTPLEYTKTAELFGLDDQSKIYFVQAAESGQYEILFGDGVFGRRPKDGAIVVVNYLAASGEQPNGASLFTADGSIDGHTNISITTLANASGGAVAEDIESIRFLAPRYYQTQGRAVTESDYEVLLRNHFPEIQAISVYGGEDHVPPVYGKVFISVDIQDADGAPQVKKDEYGAFLKERTPLGINTQFVDPDFMGVEVTTTVTYNTNTTTKLTSDIQALAHAAISQYNIDNLEDFKSTMRGSQLVAAIDGSDQSILSNDTTFQIVRTTVPTTGEIVSFTYDFGQALAGGAAYVVDATQVNYGDCLFSSAFLFNGVRSVLIDDMLGNVWVGSYSGSGITPITRVGTISYATGIVAIHNITIDSYEGAGIKVFVKPATRDISSSRNTILSIADEDVHITIVGVSA